MPIDTSIYSQLRQPEGPMQLAGQAMQMQQMGNQNALARYALSKAEREDQGQNTLAAAYKDALDPATGKVNQNKLMTALASGGQGQMIPGVQKQMTEAEKAFADMDKAKAESVKATLGIIGGALSPFAANPQSATRQGIMQTLQALQAQGVPNTERAIQSLPQDDAQLADWAKKTVLGTEHALKALEAVSQKIEFKETGGSLTPVNMNSLAGPVGPTGGRDIPKTMTIEQKLNEPKRLLELKKLETDIAQGKALTESQGNATGFGIRATNALSQIDGLENSGTFGRLSGAKESTRQALERVPVVGTAAGNIASATLNLGMSSAQQRYEQAARNFISAVLRKESGATIKNDEFDNEYRKYFPQIGDGKGVREQKKLAREDAVKALTIQAGPGGKNIPQRGTKVGGVLTPNPDGSFNYGSQ